ncbi:phage tail protein [Laribacter hongkongensis]|uniref:phage tail protein n=1 Tax=Laribacter hongkongensis TaxID=168471 RepID=UPI001EFE6376|nr:phage tail protein [Laribacter hongkongensis]MCG8995058.1 phage tail protein [Laribacter hongkongensis]MCG9011169.1 phage tail protein [Laribacter hongkongensis]MCG9023568.1 phage tail protein [Laribacter hongkongensis]MCG9047201.1 phage tail protein [Laribacter hongkongensis]MCG9074601.1 phage tail protein [Laribacter hongkongensis]
MPATYYCLLTRVGEAKLAKATALGTRLAITHLAVGDGGGSVPQPEPAQTALKHEVRRGLVNELKVDPLNPNQIIIEQVIPEEAGGWWIREVGAFDADGDLIAVGNCPESYKPVLAEGSGRTQIIRMVLIVSSTDAVTLKIDPSVVLATKQYVTETVAKAVSDHVKQSDPHPQYATDEALTQGLEGKLGKTETAADSAKLEGHPADYFAKADDLAKISGDPLLWPRTSPSRAHIQAGYAPLDGQELSRELYPDAWAAIQAGAVPVVTEAEWQADPLKRGAWTYGNGSTTFRMPDWNGKSAGSKGAVFVRGDGALSTGTPGRMQSDGVGTVAVPTRSANYTPTWGTVYLSSKSTLSPGITLPDEPGWNGIIGAVPGTVERVNMVNLGSTDTRPLNVAGVWVCRLFGVVTNPGAADAAQLATEVARLWAQKLDLSAAFGLGQTRRDVTASRALGATYYNTTQRPITVHVSAKQMSASGTSAIDFVLGSNGSTTTLRGGTSYGQYSFFSSHAVVMPGESYSAIFANVQGSYTDMKWVEVS